MSDLEIYNLYERTNPGTIETFQKRTASKMDLQTEYEKIIEICVGQILNHAER